VLYHCRCAGFIYAPAHDHTLNIYALKKILGEGGWEELIDVCRNTAVSTQFVSVPNLLFDFFMSVVIISEIEFPKFIPRRSINPQLTVKIVLFL
jgi:hypothetical protein